VTSGEPWSAESFERRYRDDPDPWDFAGSPYEQARYDAIVDALGRARYRRAYEPGCSVGVLTERLARRCDHVRALDVSATAVGAARRRCASSPHVQIEVGSVMDPPGGRYDLVVFSELGYYFDTAALDGLIAELGRAVSPGGELVACHWLGESADHRLAGDEVHQRLHRGLGARFAPVHHVRTPGFVLDGWQAR
jgi:SAM-dependent methyltransferase